MKGRVALPRAFSPAAAACVLVWESLSFVRTAAGCQRSEALGCEPDPGVPFLSTYLP